MDLLKLVRRLPYAPGFFNEEIMDKFGTKAAMPQAVFPKTDFTSKSQDAHRRTLPQAIAHRGHKINYPENSIRAFEDAVDVGAHALETDLHLTKDGVVVLSHDPDLKRCFGVDRKIRDCEWDFLKTLRTIRIPHEPLACFRDLLELFKKPKWQNVWLMLDIKFHDDLIELVRHIRETFNQVDAVDTVSWKDKVLLGYWTAQYLPLFNEYLPGYPVTNIGFSLAYSSHFLAVPNTGFCMIQASLVSPYGRRFIRDLRARGDQTIFSWTVNDEKSIDWCMRRGLNGIVTDNVPKVLEMCETFNEERTYSWSTKVLLEFIRLNFWLYLFGIVFRSRYGTCVLETPGVDKDE